MRKRRQCPRCSGREIWQAPEVADEAWGGKLAMPAAWRHDGVPMGQLEVCACGACGLVEWRTEHVDELEPDEESGVALGEDGPACASCKHGSVWHIAPMRDVRSGLSDTSELAAYTRGLTYAVRGKGKHGDDPIQLDEKAARVRQLGAKETARNLLSHGALHGRPVGHLEARVCAGCAFTDWYAHGLEEARGDGKVIEHVCPACGGEKAVELPTFDLRAEGINAKRIALGRSDWGNTKADMVMRICEACSHVDWFVTDTASLREGDAGGVTRVEAPSRAGAYRRAADETNEPAAGATAAREASLAQRHQLVWFSIAAVSAAVGLYVLVHAWAAIVPFACLAGWYLYDTRRREQASEPAGRVAVSEPPPRRFETAPSRDDAHPEEAHTEDAEAEDAAEAEEADEAEGDSTDEPEERPRRKAPL